MWKKISSIQDVYEDLACILVQGGLVLDCTCNVKYGAFFNIAMRFFDTRKKNS